MVDQKILAKLSEAFARVGKRDPLPTKQKGHRGCRGGRGKRKGPITENGKLARAQTTLSKTLSLKSEACSSVKKLAAKLTVVPLQVNRWQVTGGECQHTVIREGASLSCIDHTTSHQPKKEGFACSHEAAVRRYLVQEILRKEATS